MSELSAQSLVEFKSMGVVALDDLKKFAQASGDHNPIHQDEAVAKAMGLPGVIAHGMFVSSRIHTRALELARIVKDLQGMRVRSSQTRFKAMTFVGDEIFVGGHWQIEGPGRVKLELSARNARDEITVTTHLILGD